MRRPLPEWYPSWRHQCNLPIWGEQMPIRNEKRCNALRNTWHIVTGHTYFAQTFCDLPAAGHLRSPMSPGMVDLIIPEPVSRVRCRTSPDCRLLSSSSVWRHAHYSQLNPILAIYLTNDFDSFTRSQAVLRGQGMVTTWAITGWMNHIHLFEMRIGIWAIGFGVTHLISSSIMPVRHPRI